MPELLIHPQMVVPPRDLHIGKGIEDEPSTNGGSTKASPNTRQ